MTRDHSDTIRGFHYTNESWYTDTVRGIITDEKPHEILVGMYCEDGGTSGEFNIQWVDLAGSTAIQLQAYDDSWSALTKFQDLLEYMGEVDSEYGDESISPQEFMNKMKELGIKDLTKRRQP